MRSVTKKIFSYHGVTMILILALLIISATVYTNAYIRIFESLCNLGRSLVYCFCGLFFIDSPYEPTINNLSWIEGYNYTFLPDSWNELKIICVNFFNLFFNWENFTKYLKIFNTNLSVILRLAIIFALFVGMVAVVLTLLFKRISNDYNKESKFTKRLKKIYTRFIYPIVVWMRGYVAWFNEETEDGYKKRSVHKKCVIFLILIMFNVITIGIEFLAYYFYFCESFNFVNLYIQLYKLLIDLNHYLQLPGIIKFIVVCNVLGCIRRKIAYNKLIENEDHNEELIRTEAVGTMLVGPPGSSKTTNAVDMDLTQQKIFRKDALNNLIKNALMFPNFPWINFENCLKNEFKYHRVYNLTTARKYVNKMESRFNKCKSINRCYEYDYIHYKMEFDDGLKIQSLWKTLELYAQFYLIYTVECSLILSNFSIRDDTKIIDYGNLPEIDMDFFKRKSSDLNVISRYSHILDFDMLRLGKLMLKHNEYANCFEFGIIACSEIGKERGNQKDTEGEMRDDEEANRKNDMFNTELKMIRHSATVDNVNFVKVRFDEQRAQSLNADARDLVDVITIDRNKQEKNALPLFIFEDFISDIILKPLKRLFLKLRYRRGDVTLFIFLLDNILAIIDNNIMRKINKYGYFIVKQHSESGSAYYGKDVGNTERIDYKYFLSRKKIYSNRFATDCYKGFYDYKTKKSNIGLKDIPEFQTINASIDEMKQCNSFFINGINKAFIENEIVNKEMLE